jgi:4-alpha-glucanotransferase
LEELDANTALSATIAKLTDERARRPLR